MVKVVVQEVIVPTVEEVMDEWRARLSLKLSPNLITEVDSNLHDIYGAARALSHGQIAASVAQTEVHRGYDNLRAIMAATPLGETGPWPEQFWTTSMGRLVYYSFDAAYGYNLLTVSEVAHHLKLSVTRIGALQRELKADYIIDPDAKHPRQSRRKMTWTMLERAQAFLKARGED